MWDLEASEDRHLRVLLSSGAARRGAITFDVEFEERGKYRLFLLFPTGGRIHTVAFTETVT